MKVTFSSYSDACDLQNTFLFAMHSSEKIARIRSLDSARAEQCERENAAWLHAQQILRNAKPNVEYEIYLR